MTIREDGGGVLDLIADRLGEWRRNAFPLVEELEEFPRHSKNRVAGLKFAEAISRAGAAFCGLFLVNKVLGKAAPWMAVNLTGVKGWSNYMRVWTAFELRTVLALRILWQESKQRDAERRTTFWLRELDGILAGVFATTALYSMLTKAKQASTGLPSFVAGFNRYIGGPFGKGLAATSAFLQSGYYEKKQRKLDETALLPKVRRLTEQRKLDFQKFGIEAFAALLVLIPTDRWGMLTGTIITLKVGGASIGLYQAIRRSRNALEKKKRDELMVRERARRGSSGRRRALSMPGLNTPRDMRDRGPRTLTLSADDAAQGRVTELPPVVDDN